MLRMIPPANRIAIAIEHDTCKVAVTPSFGFGAKHGSIMKPAPYFYGTGHQQEETYTFGSKSIYSLTTS